jgi:hypothetical protein
VHPLPTSAMPGTRPLRCPNSLYAILADGVIEIKCRKAFCKPSPGIVVIHRFSATTGELLETKYYRDPKEKT